MLLVREQVQVVTPSARRNSGALDDSSRTPVPSTSKVGDTSSIVPKPQIRRRRKSESSKVNIYALSSGRDIFVVSLRFIIKTKEFHRSTREINVNR